VRPAGGTAVRRPEAGHRSSHAIRCLNLFGYVALDAVFQELFTRPLHERVNQKVIDVPMQLPGFLRSQPPVPRDASHDASARTPDIHVAPGGKESAAQRTHIQSQRPRDLKT